MLTWINQNFDFITYANQKLFSKNLWGVGSTPLGIGRVKYLMYNQNFYGGGGRSGGWGGGNSERCLKRGASALNILIHTSHAHAIVFSKRGH